MSVEVAERRGPRIPAWLIAAISGAFGLLYAFIVFQAVTLLVTQANGPLGLNGLGWTILTAAAVFPVIVFGIGFALAWRRSPGILSLVLLAGLGLVSVFWLDVVGYAYADGATLLGG